MSDGKKIQIGQKIKDTLARHLNLRKDRITSDSLLREDLNLDSVDTVELLFHLEEAFNIQIPDDDVPKLRTVRDLTEYVERRVADRP